jgi:SET domain-containing protein
MSLFADEDIMMGEFVIKYTGDITSKDPKNKYTMKYRGIKLWIDGSKSNTLGKYMNHGHNPNCENVIWAIKGMPRLCFFARKEIKKDDKLTFHYGWTLRVNNLEELKVLGTPCHRKGANCPHVIEKAVIVK